MNVTQFNDNMAQAILKYGDTLFLRRLFNYFMCFCKNNFKKKIKIK